jgi:hypothetical protein
MCRKLHPTSVKKAFAAVFLEMLQRNADTYLVVDAMIWLTPSERDHNTANTPEADSLVTLVHCINSPSFSLVVRVELRFG